MIFFLAVPLFILIVLWIVWTYNRFIQLQRGSDEAWANIDAMLKRRHDLIPALVSAVKGYAKHEKTLLEKVTHERSKALASSGMNEKAKREEKLGGAVHSILALGESYPSLRASENFSKLSTQLTETEDLLEKARRYYNATVRDLNTKLGNFPDFFVARVFGFMGREFSRSIDGSS